MKHHSDLRPALFAFVLGSSVLGSAGPASAADTMASVPLVPHHAVYKLSLLRSSGTKAPEAVEGLLSYDFTGSDCDGYAMSVRQMTALQPQEGEARVSEMQTASFEGADSHDYRFTIATKGQADSRNGVNGTAHKSRDGLVAVALNQPKSETLDLEPGVLFPTEHLKRVLNTARTGGKLLTAAVFDGSDTGKKVFETLSVIGKASEEPATEKAAQVDVLRNTRHWPVAISYFDGSKRNAPPEYVMSFDLYENGIARGLKLDYADFVLAGDLTELKIMPDEACKR